MEARGGVSSKGGDGGLPCKCYRSYDSFKINASVCEVEVITGQATCIFLQDLALEQGIQSRIQMEEEEQPEEEMSLTAFL